MDLLAGLIGSKRVNELQLLIHVSHLLESLIVRCFCLTSTSGTKFVLECLNDLVKLIGALDWDCISLVILGVKDCNIVIACLVTLTHLSRIALCLILNTFVFGLDDTSYTFLRRFF